MQYETWTQTFAVERPEHGHPVAGVSTDSHESRLPRPRAVELDPRALTEDQSPGGAGFAQDHLPEGDPIESMARPASSSGLLGSIDIGMPPMNPSAQTQPPERQPCRQERSDQRDAEDTDGIVDEQLEESRHGRGYGTGARQYSAGSGRWVGTDSEPDSGS